MKLRYVLLLIILITGCTAPEKQSTETTVETAPESLQWLMFEGEQSKPHVVLVSGDEEYRSEEALPQLAKILSKHHGFNCTVLFAQDPERPGIADPNYLHNIPGLEQLKKADLMVIFTRFRALPDDQMKHIDDYLISGRPVLGIRTATHAFRLDNAPFESSYLRYGNYYDQDDEWKGGFGRLILGEKWISHHGEHGHQSTRGIAAAGAENHAILNGIDEGGVWGATDVYGVRLPLPGDSSPILLGQVVNRMGERDENDPLLGMRPIDNELPVPIMKKNEQNQEVSVDQNDPMMPVVWTKTYQLPGGKQGSVLTTTLGASVDLLQEGTRRMLVNGVYWLLEQEVPAKANVDLVGSFKPSRFAFYEDSHWDSLNMEIATLQ
ncbi:MAG: hypothetical protein DHS20C17_16140 [Cyclobacteriaceae bacterium]|nr:MAG: hypothetical protein DHS20C17_16140 [Cyclobacteriaceae bacterium]